MFGFIKRFFWFCSGANIAFLEREECQTEHSKYAGIGVTVFFVGIWAGLAAGYAFFTIFDNKGPEDDQKSIGMAIAFGVLWGMMIFNFDRFLVSTLRKETLPPESRWSKKLRSFLALLFQKALPRILLAFILAFIISKPLEMRAFNKEIEAELPAITAEKDRQNKTRILRDQDASGQFKEENDEIAQMKEVVREGDKKINDAKTKYEDAERTLIEEYNGRKQSSQPGIGHDYKIYEKQRDLAKNDYDSLIAPNNPDSFKAQLEAKRKRLASLEESISIRKKALLDEANQKTELFDGLATRLTALSAVTESQRIVFLAGWLIFIMVFMLEIFPVLSKLFASYGPYERLVDEHEQKGALQGEKEMLVLREEVSRLRDSKEARTQALLDLQKKMLSELDIAVTNLSQAEINDFRREFGRRAISDLYGSINGNSLNQNNNKLK